MRQQDSGLFAHGSSFAKNLSDKSDWSDWSDNGFRLPAVLFSASPVAPVNAAPLALASL